MREVEDLDEKETAIKEQLAGMKVISDHRMALTLDF